VHQTAFEAIKALVVSADCLTTIDHENLGDNKIFMTCDASDWRTGGTLSFGPTWETACPIAFDSMQLKDVEKNYPVHEKELLAIIQALKKWHSDLLGTHFYVYMDHRTLENFNAQKDLSQRQLRWQEFLSQYDMMITYIRGEDNTVADALSRLPPNCFPDEQSNPPNKLCQCCLICND
jgi:RNase H-like domain found in reverse transcriptase